MTASCVSSMVTVPSGVFFGSAANATLLASDTATAAMIPSTFRRAFMVLLSLRKYERVAIRTRRAPRTFDIGQS